jgi:putative PIN family toxin of toxin-antitoxin system
MPRAVADTTVLISALLTPDGAAAELLGQARAGAFILCLSREILEELRSRLLHRRRIRRRYRYSDAQVHQHCADLEAVAQLTTALPSVRVVERDPNDDMVIAGALAARADYLVTRDKDLLSLGA